MIQLSLLDQAVLGRTPCWDDFQNGSCIQYRSAVDFPAPGCWYGEANADGCTLNCSKVFPGKCWANEFRWAGEVEGICCECVNYDGACSVLPYPYNTFSDCTKHSCSMYERREA